MRILVDEAIWGAPGRFADLGEVSTFWGRRLRPDEVRRADVLLVRSVTPVGPALLEGSQVRLVGTASTGVDHIDTAYLTRRGIRLVDAAGCNARPVAEYVLTVLLWLALKLDWRLERKTLAVVGVGRIGSIVAAWAEVLGMNVLRFDPPLAASGSAQTFTDLSRLSEADIVTLHVPLSREGTFATIGMVDRRWLHRLRKGAYLINTSRGEVVCEGDLAAALGSGQLGGAVLDVWRNEPRIDRALAAGTLLATPHMAGYSEQARRRASRRLYEAARAFSNERASKPESLCETQRLSGSSSGVPARGVRPSQEGLAMAYAAACQACPIEVVDARFRAAMGGSDWPAGYDRVRSACSDRQEFTETPAPAFVNDAWAGKTLEEFGFIASGSQPSVKLG